MFYLILISVLWWTPPTNVSAVPGAKVESDSLRIRVLNYDALKPLLHQENDTTYVVNFWATWCAPCVKELPYFISLDSMYADQPLKLILVSLDFKKDYIRKLQPFADQHRITDRVVVLEDNRQDYWIGDIAETWSGGLPATLIYRGEKRAFFERTFHSPDELHEIVKPFIN